MNLKFKLSSAFYISLVFTHHPQTVLAASNSSAIYLPAPTGPYNTLGTRIQPLTDYSRNDTFAPTQFREILLSLYYPSTPSAVSGQETIKYLPPLTEAWGESIAGVPNGTLALIRTNSYLNATFSVPAGHNLKTVIFSPGYGGSRLIYTALLEDLASHGYFIVSVDHPYDGGVVEFPDGHAIYEVPEPANATSAEILPYVDQRVADLLFVAESLPTLIKSLDSSSAGQKIDIQNLGIFGHSLGGASSTVAMASSPHFKAGSNMDGTQFGLPLPDLAPRPFLFLSHETQLYPTWTEFAETQTGWLKDIQMNGTVHDSYTDEPALVDLLGFQEAIGDTLGTIDGMRSETLQRDYVRAFFDFGLKGAKEGILSGPRKEFPEMSFVELK